MKARTQSQTVSVRDYLHESSCGLEDEHATVSQAFTGVLEAVAERAPIECEVAACGCGSCFVTEKPAAVFWVAQRNATDEMAVKFDSEDDDFTRSDLGDLLVEVAEDHGVPVSWNGNTRKCVYLGVDDRYTNLDPGTRVRHDRYGEGTVLDPDFVYHPDTPVRVFDQEDYDGYGLGGDLVGRFPDRDAADAFVEQQDKDADHFKIDRETRRGTSDGDAIVLFDGDEDPGTIRVSNLTVLDG